MSRNICAVGQMLYLLFGIGKPLLQTESTGRVLDMFILLEGIGNSHILEGFVYSDDADMCF